MNIKSSPSKGLEIVHKGFYLPKRTNQFQDLISILERQIVDKGASVHTSKFLKDAVTGEEREVDIVIEHLSGVHPIRIGIEVIAHKRRASTTWIEEISAKHRDLPIDKTIVVSKSGYYKPAIQKAKALKIDALTLREATDLDWSSKLDSIQRLRIKGFIVPYLKHATLVFYYPASLPMFSTVDLWQVSLFSSTGDKIGTTKEILEGLIANNKFITTVEEEAFTGSGTIINAELLLGEGTYAIDQDQYKHSVRSIKFEAICQKVVSDASLQKCRYRDVAVALACGSSLGHEFQIVLSQRTEEEPMILGMQIKSQNLGQQKHSYD